MQIQPSLFLSFLLSLLFSVTGTVTLAADFQEPVTVQLKWRHAFQSAGFYAADIKGFYKEAGLEVTIRERLKKISPIDLIMAGEAEYVVANGSALLLAHLQGKPVRALAVIFQHSPSILLSRKDSGIRTPADLVGRRVMRSRMLSTREFDAMLIHEGIEPEAMEIVDPSWDINDLVTGRVDAMSTYITSGPFQLRKLGVEPSFLQPINYGIDFYGDTLAATARETHNNPDRVRAFTQATLKGWQYAFNHQEEIIKYILTLPGVRKRGLTTESLRYEAREMEQLIQPKLVELGHINPGRFQHMANILVKLNLAEQEHPLDDFIFNPDFKPQRKWFLLLLGASAGILSIGSIAWFVNRQLTRSVAEKTREYKESQQRFHDLVVLLPEMVWESDLQGTLTYVNQAALNHFKQDNDAFEHGLKCLDMLVPEDRQRAAQALKRIAQGEELGLNEYTALTGDGSTFPVWTRSTLIKKDGIPVGMRGIIINISERKQLEEQLHQAQKMEAIGTLAGGIAHDFNNILTAILGYTELSFLHLGDEQKLQGDLKHVRKGALRARDLVTQILTFSRKQEKTDTVIEPALIVKESLKLLRSSMPSTINLEQQIEIEHKIEMDPTQFHQIMMNLCTNAIHAMEETGGRLTVNLKAVQLGPQHPAPQTTLAPGAYICLEIQDTGQGIDQDTREKIFDPYFTTKEQGKGTGLGLSVVHGIVRKYKGDITLESVPGQGSTFRVYLPAMLTDTAPSSHSSRTGEGKLEPLSKGSGERIMIIDDEEELITMLTDLLVHWGYRVCTYIDSRQALKHFTRNSDAYDLVLTDMTMPELTGVELSEKILAIRPDLPIILMTGYSEQIDRHKAMTMGIRGFVQKPLQTDTLLEDVRALLKKG